MPTAEELEAEAAKTSSEAMTEFVLAFINFQRQLGAAEGLWREAKRERSRAKANERAIADDPSNGTSSRTNIISTAEG